ncbi:MAG TPA: hypothetical protein VFC19_06530 [Candidatus Limnocylindrales bacterium]|nr:hypothetical protein [Candidatus Limnocylindrales bacterium]
MQTDRPVQVSGAFARFVAGKQASATAWPSRPGLSSLLARTAPAYATFLGEHGIDAAQVKTERDFGRLPMTGKDSELRRK